MNDAMIGTIRKTSREKWENFKAKFPKVSDELEKAVVKDIQEEDLLIIEEERVDKILNDMRNGEVRK